MRKKLPFSSPRNPHLLEKKNVTGRCQAVKMKAKSGTFAVCGAAGEVGRALHLTAPLSEPGLNPRTIALCHLEVHHTLIMPSVLEICVKTLGVLTKLFVPCVNSSLIWKGMGWAWGYKENWSKIIGRYWH